jgi:uncharacterized membrane protein YkvA (DUF1232 family)
MAILERLVKKIRPEDPQRELAEAEASFKVAAERAAHEPLINIRLAGAVMAVCRELVQVWPSLPKEARPWLCAAIRYFGNPNDEMNDLNSFMGFEDDCDVLNACLRIAGREDLLIFPDEYD